MTDAGARVTTATSGQKWRALGRDEGFAVRYRRLDPASFTDERVTGLGGQILAPPAYVR
jgi:hypothetical protein